MDSEQRKYILAAAPKDYTGAALTEKYISLKNFAEVEIIITTGAWAAGTAAVTLKQATAVAGTSAKELPFDKMFHDETLTGTLVEEAVVSNTFPLDTALKTYVIRVDARSLDGANGFDCLALSVATPGANADLYSAVYVLAKARYGEGVSALVD